MTEIPIIDLARFWGTEADRLDLGREVDTAAREFGFFQITGHRLPQERIDAMVAASTEFFSLPVEIKARCTPTDPAINRGYAARGTEALSYSIGRDAPPDLFEAFNIGEDVVDYSDPFYAAEHDGAFAPNIWPQWPPDLRPALVNYFESARQLALTLTEVFAVALGLQPGWFTPYVDRSTTTMRTIRYERRSGEGDPLPGSSAWARTPTTGSSRCCGQNLLPACRSWPRWWMDRRHPRRQRARHQPRRSDRAVDQRPVAVHGASRRAADCRRWPGRSPQRRVLPRRQLGRGDRMPADLRQRGRYHRGTRR